jgi:Asp-tRNA(Asn)/Glu-tRNA(Gln) amidotransferase A subunit family amidase
VTHPQDLSLREQADGVLAGTLSGVELLAATLARIEERDRELNSIPVTFPAQSEQMLAEAPLGPLHGVPVAVKDMYALPWRGPHDGTAREQLPRGESAVYRALRDAGAVVVGHTNTHFWGGGSTGHVSAYGPVGNPWDVTRCGGGSSGGSAASVGARLVAGSIGADGGGSIRLPGAYCGVTGLKSTFGTVSPDGYSHPYASVDAHGVFARDSGDARLLAEVLFNRELPAGDGDALRAAVVTDPFWTDLDPEVERACRDVLGATGWAVEEIALDGAEHAQVAAVLRLTLENLPGIGADELAEADPLAKALVKYEKLLPAELLARADRVRAQLRRSAAAAFERFDLLVWPTVPAPAPPIEAPVVELPSGQYPADAPNVRQTGFGNLCGIPGITVPAGLHSSGLPIGLQLQAAWGAESLLLDAAEHVEQATERAYVDALPPIAAGAPA